MTFWLDAHLSPALASWIRATFQIEAVPIRDLGLQYATDSVIFLAAKEHNVVFVTKDSDFVTLLRRFGPPPKILWLTCGNTSNNALQTIFSDTIPAVLSSFDSGEPLVEISNRW